MVTNIDIFIWVLIFIQLISVLIYLYSAFHNMQRLKAALQKMIESTLQFTVICYRRTLSYVFQKCITVS